jgi:hypothetical protein
MLKPLHLASVALAAAAFMFGTLAYTNNSNPPTRLTGAPGESDCSNCHGTASAGATNAAKFFISTQGSVTSFTPGQVVNLNVQIVNPATVKNGFELTVRNGANAAFGSLQVTDAAHTNLTSVGGKQFLRQTSAGNQQKSWNFAWAAPAAQDTLTAYFYAAGVESNNTNRDDGGDKVYRANFKLRAQRNVTAINAKLIETTSVTLFPNPCVDAVHFALTLQQAASVVARLINTAGVAKEERTFFLEAGKQTVRWAFGTKPLPGEYVLSLTAGGYTTSNRLVIE